MTTDLNDLVLRPARAKWLLLALVSAGGLAAGCFMFGSVASTFDRVLALSVIVFCGVGAIVGVAQLVPGASFLRVSADGLLVRSLWHNTLYRWSDVDEFGVAEFCTVHYGFKRRHRMVGFNFSASYAARRKTSGLRTLNCKLVGYEAVLPDNYGYDCAELSQHLNTLKARFAVISPSARTS